MIGLLGCLGLLLLVVAAAVRLGPLAGALALAVASLGLRPLWRLVLGKLRRLRSRNLLCSKGGSADSDLEPCEAKLPVWIVTGFLGSGKTTLVNHILRQGYRLLVIQNETGDTSLDAELVIEAAGEENVMLINGCACCQIRRDLRDLLCRVRDKGMGDVEGIVIECCGLADPRAVVQTFLLDEEMKRSLQIQEVIAVIDAAHVARHLLATTSTPAARLVEVQIAFASVLLLNKIDQCDDFDALRPAIRAINSVQILPCTYCEVDFAALFAGAGRGPCTKPWRQDGGWSPFRALTEDIQLRSICVSDHEDQQPSPEGPLPERPHCGMETDAAALQVPSGDEAELDDPASLHVVPADGDESPAKRHRAHMDQPANERRLVPATEPEPTDADSELARLLAKKEMENTPSWALALSHSLTEQVTRIANNTIALQDQICDVDRRHQQRMAEIVKQSDDRAAELQQQLDEMKQDVKALKDRAVGSADAAGPSTPFTTRFGSDETDFNHMVLGGWPKDSARRTIEEDSWEVLRRMTEITVQKLAVYGKRASTSHAYLPPLPPSEARTRFYELQKKYEKIITPTGGVPLWLSPSRPLEIRMKNKATRYAWRKLQSVCDMKEANPTQITSDDVDWSRQIVWLKERRVLAPSVHQLNIQPHERYTTITYHGDQGETARLVVNLSVLEAGLTGQSVFMLEYGTWKWVVWANLSPRKSQVIVLDSLVVDRILQTYMGTRWIAVRFVDVQHTERILVGVHMPHRDNAEQYYEQSVLDLELFLRSFQHLPCSLAGDWNADVDDSRFATLSSMCSSLSYKCFHPTAPTWHGRLSQRMLDYFFFNRHALEGKHMHAEPELQHNTAPAKEVGSDHDLVQLKLFLLCSKGVRQPRPRKRNRCNKWILDRDRLDHVNIDEEFFRQQSAKQQWEVIRSINDTCARPKPSLKYKDPPDLKELCRQRHYTNDPADKTRLAKQILSRRREARSLWLQGLMRRASTGDGSATAYLHNRSKPKPSHNKLIQASGGKQAAAEQVQERMQELLSATPAERDAVCGWEARLADTASSSAPCRLFDDSEIQQSVGKLRLGKASGMSGVSAELIRALAQLPEGLAVVRHHMNTLLRDGEPPADYYKAYVALIEKCPQVSRARDLRPINLLEVLNKLFMGLLTTRMQPTVPCYPCQFAGRPGHQTLDALSTAHHLVDRETKWNKSSVWISLDVSAAFDSLALSQVGAFLHEEVGPHCRWEALRMFQVMKHSHLEFHYMGQQWSVDQTSGVQQGGSHSSWIFSCVLARQIQRLFQQWHHTMPPSLHSTYGLLYIDDILICLPDWHVADAMYEQLCDALKSLGLTINVEKTHLMASHSFLLEGELTLPQHSVLRQLKWATKLQYLKKWIRCISVRVWGSLELDAFNRWVLRTLQDMD
ncbi:CBWD5, partial [Symbiodinium sp. KB8]